MEPPNGNRLYILGDGDDVLHRIEFFLLSGDLVNVSRFSNSVVGAIDSVKAFVAATMGAEVVYGGGDDIFFHLPSAKYHRSDLEEASARFRQLTGNTISFGVGTTIEQAYLNLRKAKASGKGAIVEK